MAKLKWKTLVNDTHKTLDKIELQTDKEFAEKQLGRLACHILVTLYRHRSPEYKLELIEELEDMLSVPERW